ncbi:tyrosine--tRNA ligase [Marine Group I thaumarchaeote]|uniref:tyrosine--tRNA ligase n=1 Tax=Marine Group I thaumarchaeote TaxID=2511932 RepID=A0A7K4MF59_9ARCH|nr:tyrosine--tRNA ligase [Candidatus Nitrosopumilus sp. MTA1]NWJ19936.1 tyrosine--tRNA ligase [Marine Group I thaumarchaeote]NWJ27847.1 tyrosine--tRNA ligase [Marine Group I thaumarchaeote]NWJ56457.1 tyrosine--tRNA ligase [Marine Group I thaumarchaeote]NWJ83276.1 tyrosine--tRNA ligase [Marine Group I thaumarchaeote]
MDILEKVDLIERPPTEEVVTHDELIELFKTNSSPKHYIGLEISGFLHLGSLISTGFKINDFVKAGVKCTVFLADWHTLINDKLGGDWDVITKVSKYYADAFKLVCPGVNIVLGSELYDSRKEYWREFVEFTKHMSLKRTMRTLTIMGRTEDETKIDLAKLLYPPMQAVDIHSLDLDIVHSGMDQRKIHMLVREIFPKMKWKVPVAVHHKLLPGLSKPADTSDSQVLGKMSKSDPNSGVFIHNSDDEIKKNISKAWCEEANTQNNPLLEIARTIIFHEFNEMNVERPEKFGGNISYTDYNQLETDFAEKKLHPGDLKQTVGNYLIKIISPIREKLNLSKELRETIEKNY